MRAGLVLSAAAGVCCLIAASAPQAGAVQERPPVGELRPCGSRGDSSSPQQLPTPAGVRIGPLVIWPSVRTQVAPAGSQAIAWQFVSKAPIVLPARTRAVLAIAPEAVELAAFQSAGRSIGWISSVEFEACREREPAFPGAYRGTVGRYTGFPFAIASTRRSTCIPMEVWLDGATTPIRKTVPFGRSSC